MDDTFGIRVRKLRVERHWSQQELSLRSGISTPHISSIERGKRHPSLEYAKRIADALGVELSALCDEASLFQLPRMLRSTDEWPLYIQNFLLNESAAPYLEAAHRMSKLPAEDAELLSLIIELLAQKRKFPAMAR